MPELVALKPVIADELKKRSIARLRWKTGLLSFAVVMTYVFTISPRVHPYLEVHGNLIGFIVETAIVLPILLLLLLPVFNHWHRYDIRHHESIHS